MRERQRIAQQALRSEFMRGPQVLIYRGSLASKTVALEKRTVKKAEARVSQFGTWAKMLQLFVSRNDASVGGGRSMGDVGKTGGS